jgi:hypothetical protein
MRRFLLAWTLGLLLAAMGSGRAADGIRVTAPNVFSYEAPPGWKMQTTPTTELPAPAAVELKNGVIEAMITVTVDTGAGPLDQWCKQSLAKNKVDYAAYNPRIGDPAPFETAAGVKGFRALMNLTILSKNLQFVVYFFSGSADAKIVATCSSPVDEADHYAPLFDSAMKTLVPN